MFQSTLSSNFELKNLVLNFGSKSTIGRNFIDTFITKISDKQNSQLVDYKANWKEIMSKIYGERIFNDVKVSEFSNWYNIQFSCSFENILFSIQTYYALILKLVANELVRNKFRDKNDAFAVEHENSIDKILFSYMDFIENGGYCTKLVAINFLDGLELFKWYLLAWDQTISLLIKSIVLKVRNNKLLSKDSIEDSITAFNEFYQDLIPQKVRKFLGEVYTPVWLADYIVEHSSWDGNVEVKVIDPSCGSGIFLTLFINKIRSKYEAIFTKSTLLESILNVCVGLDINPLAILTARTNFLIKTLDLFHTGQKPFFLPIVQGDLLELSDKNQTAKLETDKIVFFNEKFDFVLGNPPWINWEFLPEFYKKNNMNLWKHYGLFSAFSMKKMLGEAKYDLSAIFIYKCIDYLLKDQGILHFIVPLTLVRGLPGQGFRKNYFDVQAIRVYFNLLEVQDLSNFQPFTNTNANVGIIKIMKGSESRYPVPYTSWIKQGPIIPNQSWINVQSRIKQMKKYAIPLNGERKELVNLLILDKELAYYDEIKPVFRSSEYTAFEGANTEGLNSVFWITSLQRNDKELYFENVTKSQKKKLPKIKSIPIESDLVYPLIRSKNIRKWSYTIDSFIIFTLKYDKTKKLTNIDTFRQLYPLTFKYFKIFEQQLLDRSSFKNKSKGKPFYLIYGKENMKSRYKVVWNRIGSEITAAVTELYNDPILGNKPPIPQETIVYLPTDTLEEAHFICAVMNSKLFSLLVSIMQVKGTKGFGTPGILEKIYIPKYDKTNTIHKELVHISKHLHTLENNKQSSCEEELNNLILKLYQIDPETVKK